MRRAMLIDEGRLKVNGYSMLELLLVVVMIGILVAIALPSLIGARRGSLEAMAKTRLTDLAARQEAFRSALGRRRYAISFADMEKVELPDGKKFFKNSDLKLNGWKIDGEFDDPKGRTFGFTAETEPPDDSSPRYCIHEDGVLRKETAKGQACDRRSAEARE